MAAFLDKYARRRHVREKIRNTQKKMWDMEFFRSQLRNEREGIRVEYDRLKEAMDAAVLRLKTAKETSDLDAAGQDNLQKLIDRLQPDLVQLESQMAQIDIQVEGEDVESEGQRVHKQGVNDTLENYHSLISLLREYLKRI